ncbi:MAG: AAA family ATPase [Bacteroidetes bacterium]|nr:AAA family ATPase [Bacteroidota bacterium]
MKISIENFKSIRKLHQFEVKPFTVLSGVNSAGKSSFVQLLLLLKQTLEKSSTETVFNNKGDYYTFKNANDVFYAKDSKNKISFGLTFNSTEFKDMYIPQLGKSDYKVAVLVKFLQNDENIVVSDFNIKINIPDSEKKNYLKLTLEENELYEVESDSDLYGKDLTFKKFTSPIDFVAFYPLSYEVTTIGRNDQDEPVDIVDKKLFTIDWLKKSINSIFNSISYICPARIEPKEDYLIPKTHNDVGKAGQFASQILKEQSGTLVSYRRLGGKDNGIEYLSDKRKLLDAVKYWMCDVFDVADDIYSEKEEDSYRIILVNKNLKVNIKHVGFGISQLLPIVVQGLIMKEDGILIVEQPEIHLHPKIQSLLYDFLYSLTLDGKKVIVETHSSHFITRMRRRIAEDESNEMDDRISLTFIEDNIFRTLEIDDYGTILNYYPKDFVEQPAEEMRAIVEAQIRKRKAND